MHTETLLPPLALALGRLRQPRPDAPRPWPYVPRATIVPTNDFLIVAPAEALLGHTAACNSVRSTATAIPGAEAARTYWFDL